jgi:DNA-binding MarR family transcriptional regulator
MTTAAMDAVTARARYMMGAHAEAAWSATDAAAWEGLLEAARILRRGAEQALEDAHGLSISMLGIMGRLARAPHHTLRQTELAAAMGLSVSRVSRVVDLLEERGLVERRRCPSDARATNVTLTHEGGARAAEAQATVHAYADATFVRRLDAQERATLARVFGRLVEG